MTEPQSVDDALDTVGQKDLVLEDGQTQCVNDTLLHFLEKLLRLGFLQQENEGILVVWGLWAHADKQLLQEGVHDVRQEWIHWQVLALHDVQNAFADLSVRVAAVRLQDLQHLDVQVHLVYRLRVHQHVVRLVSHFVQKRVQHVHLLHEFLHLLYHLFVVPVTLVPDLLQEDGELVEDVLDVLVSVDDGVWGVFLVDSGSAAVNAIVLLRRNGFLWRVVSEVVVDLLFLVGDACHLWTECTRKEFDLFEIRLVDVLFSSFSGDLSLFKCFQNDCVLVNVF